ncbi:hypothetical protein OTU49_016867 [Cherax quadricarinatus]|uniref:Uncharacterized protein n=1 Tax=Cherax quadricarinatus TaxID=27406 RepID=A0AAW0YFF7_CHEQU
MLLAVIPHKGLCKLTKPKKKLKRKEELVILVTLGQVGCCTVYLLTLKCTPFFVAFTLKMVKFAEAEKRGRGGEGSDRRYAPVVMVERAKMNRAMWESLKAHIIRERKRKKERTGS